MHNALWKSFVALLVAGTVVVLPIATGGTHAGKIGGPLNIIAWQGYTDPSFVKPFEAQTGCKLSVLYAGSSDEMFSKFRQGGGTIYDLVSASGDASLRFIDSGVVQSVDLSRIPNWKNLNPVLKSPPHNTVRGKHYVVSFMWGPAPLTYNTK